MYIHVHTYTQLLGGAGRYDHAPWAGGLSVLWLAMLVGSVSGTLTIADPSVLASSLFVGSATCTTFVAAVAPPIGGRRGGRPSTLHPPPSPLCLPPSPPPYAQVGWGAAEATCLVQVLPTLTKLTEIDLSQNRFDGPAASALAGVHSRIHMHTCTHAMHAMHAHAHATFAHARMRTCACTCRLYTPLAGRGPPSVS